MSSTDLVPLRTVAQELGIRTDKLTKLSKDGKFPPIVVMTAHRRFVSRRKLEEWIEAKEQEAQARTRKRATRGSATGDPVARLRTA